MSHKPYSQLRKEIEEAKQQVPLGSIRFHYKHPDRHYLICDIVFREANNLPMVIYEPLYEEGKGVHASREFSSRIQTVERKGQMLSRFTLLAS